MKKPIIFLLATVMSGLFIAGGKAEPRPSRHPVGKHIENVETDEVSITFTFWEQEIDKEFEWTFLEIGFQVVNTSDQDLPGLMVLIQVTCVTGVQYAEWALVPQIPRGRIVTTNTTIDTSGERAKSAKVTTIEITPVTISE